MGVKPSRYNLILELPDGKIAAHNHRNGAFLLFTEECAGSLRQALADPVGPEDGLTMILQEFGFLVPEACDEPLEIQEEMFRHRFMKPTGITVAPTLDCNLRCTYCYEQGYRQHGTMSAEVEEALYAYLERVLPGTATFGLNWYGGEPLLCQEHILRMSARVKEMCDKLKIPFNTGLVTNGTLLTQDLVSRLIPLGLSSIQVTLDGPREVNDQRRAYASGHGSVFDAVMNSLSGIDIGAARLSLRCNIDADNAASAKQLLYELRDRGLTKFEVFPARVTPVHGGCKALGSCYDMEEFMTIRSDFVAVARELGIRSAYKPVPRRSYCCGDSAYGMVLGPDGAVYKCWEHIGDPDFVVDHLLFGRSLSNPIYSWTAYDPTVDPQCRDCEILPLCMGGCPEKARVLGNGKRECNDHRYDAELMLRTLAQEYAGRAGAR